MLKFVILYIIVFLPILLLLSFVLANNCNFVSLYNIQEMTFALFLVFQ